MKKILKYSALLIFLWACGRNNNKDNNTSNATQSHEKTSETITGSIKTDGVTIYYKAVGSGTPIVILHDGPGFFHDYLLPYFNRLADKYRVIYFDQRGNGKSSFPADSSFTLNNYLNDIAALQKQLNINKINLLGHSFGAFLAENYAARYPNKVNTLVLSDPLPVSSLALQQDDKNAQDKRTEAESQLLVNTMKSKQFKSNDPATFKKVYEMLEEVNVKDSVTLNKIFKPVKFTQAEANRYLVINSRGGRMLLNYDLTDTLQNITAHTLILHGAMDNVTLDDAQDLQNAIKNAELDIIRKSVHYSFAENEQDYFRQLNLFYDKYLKNVE